MDLGMIEELARHGYSLSPGTINPLLHSMERARYLSCEPRHVDGRPRKYHTITSRGREVLAEARQKLRELTREVSPRRRGREPSS